MFSFHKPRVYRSVDGCCICRAKSSSSRFTDSRRYENDSMKCFDLKHPRQGEICNACVLLVKRYKRLPVGSNRHWGHVVDARAGPGTKAMSRYKKYREPGDEGNNTSNSSANSNSNTANQSSSPTTSSSSSSRARARNKNIIAEKFSKIFKKTKKTTASTTTQSKLNTSPNAQTNKSSGSGSGNSTVVGTKRRVTATSNWSDARIDSLPTTPDSLDSDYEDTHCGGDDISGGGVLSASDVVAGAVQFQTQTRASTYRTRHSLAGLAAMGGRKTATATTMAATRKLGSKRRKTQLPRRHRRLHFGENVQFFDESEWQERKSCCGMVYECTEAPDTLLLDLAHYRPCAEHKQQQQQQQQPNASAQSRVVVSASVPSLVTPVQPIPIGLNANAIVQTNPTPALKKHHLFFKRQSECFPHGDGMGSGGSYSSTPATAVAMTPIAGAAMHANNLNATTTTTGAAAAVATTTTFVPRHSIAKVATISTAATAAASIGGGGGGGGGGGVGKSHNFLHKLKSDVGGKIGKHTAAAPSTLVSSATRLKATVDVSGVKQQLVKTVEKSYVLATAKPTITAISAPPPQHHQQQQMQHMVQQQQNVYHTQLHLQQPQPYVTNNGSGGVVLTTAMASPSPTLSSSSSTSTMSTKFSDNSSDSGFDENLQDRKSASPLQEDTERKLLARPGVQTMFLASGVQIQGQQQNLMLTGNEMAAKLMHTRKQNATTTTLNHNINNSQHNQHMQNALITTTTAAAAAAAAAGAPNSNRLNSTNSTTAVKIAQLIGGATATASSNSTTATATHPKMRTIYNNNTIQHENGITTIVPASSLAACSQTAAMHNAVGPSTVTITPAPHSIKMTPTGHNGVSHLNVISMTNSQQQQQQQQHHHHHQPMIVTAGNSNGGGNANGGNSVASISNINQKFILVKTATKYNNSSSGGTFAPIGAALAAPTTATTATAATTTPSTIKTLNN